VTNGQTWILNESVGLQQHAMAVARAVGLPFELKRLQVTGALRCLPAWVQMQLSPARLLASVEIYEPSWPSLIIAIGRRSVPIALSLKSLSETRCFALHIRPCRKPEHQFDLVADPMNNAFNSSNEMATFDAVYSVTPVSGANESLNDRVETSMSDIELVASVIKGALRLEGPEPETSS
jgi:mitochondrial fission protein ELM1